MDSTAPLPTTVTLTHDGERRHLARLLLRDEAGEVLKHPYLSVIAAACLPAQTPLPAGIEPAIATLVLRIAEARELLGEVPPPWSEDFGEPVHVPSRVREAMPRVREAMAAAEIHPSDEPELHRVLAGELDDSDADWVVETLDDAAAQVADRCEPRLRGALPSEVRDDWRHEWRDFAHVLVRAAHAGTS